MDVLTILSPNIELENKDFRGTKIPAYSSVLSTYIYTYAALHIHCCLKCKLLRARQNKFDPNLGIVDIIGLQLLMQLLSIALAIF